MFTKSFHSGKIGGEYWKGEDFSLNTEQHAFIRQLYLEMYDMMMSYARSALKNESRAEEAVQEAFQIACQKPIALMNSPNPRGWMINTLKNTVRNAQHDMDRDSRLLAAYLALHSPQVAVTENRVSFEVDYGNMAHLEEFKLLEDMVLKGKSQLEMAQKRGISLAACKKRVQRAKETLRKMIE